MLTYTIGNYIVEIFDAKPNYTDFINQYDAIYIDDTEYHPASVVGIRIYEDEEQFKQVAFGTSGGATGVFKSSVIVTDNHIVCCCSDSVFCLSVPELELLWKTKVDTATAFQIFPLGKDYIIHGELEISRLSGLGEIIWQQSGADIFTTPDGTDNDFIITDEYILTTDWDGRKYKFNFDGNIIE